jgi:hypothetical protein
VAGPKPCCPRDHRPETNPGNPDLLKAKTRPASRRSGHAQETSKMSKEKNRGNKEIKKPKKEKVKVLATANSNAGKSDTKIAGKTVK